MTAHTRLAPRSRSAAVVPRTLLAVLTLSALACQRPMRTNATVMCPPPDSAGMSLRLASRFVASVSDSVVRKMLRQHGVVPEQLTAPVLLRDVPECRALVSAWRDQQRSAEGVVFYRSGPYVLASPWRDYARRAEWKNRGEWVPLVVLDASLDPLLSIAM